MILVNVRSLDDIEKLSDNYGESAMFESVDLEGETFSIPDLRFYADNTDCIDWELRLI